MAALAESYSDHLISKSLKEAYAKKINPAYVGNIEEIPGHGVRAQVSGKNVWVGNAKLMDRIGALWKNCSHLGTIVHVAEEGLYQGHIVIADEIPRIRRRRLVN
jgi:Cd2+/Zn2+-exporting ATPase